MVVDGWLARAAAARPRQPALLTAEGACSYAELYAWARAGSHALAARGAVPGARVAIALPPGLAFARALHACMLLGAVAVPVDVRLTAAGRRRSRRLRRSCRAAAGRRQAGGRWGRARACSGPASGPPRERRPRPRRGRGRGAHLGKHRRAGARRADLRKHHLECARLGGRARRGQRGALAVCAARGARRRTLDPAALGDLRHDRGRTRALRGRAGDGGAVRAAGEHR